MRWRIRYITKSLGRLSSTIFSKMSVLLFWMPGFRSIMEIKDYFGGVASWKGCLLT